MTWAQLVGAVVELMSLCLFLKYELTNYEINLTLTLICCIILSMPGAQAGTIGKKIKMPLFSVVREP
jgi:hypothetical protein